MFINFKVMKVLKLKKVDPKRLYSATEYGKDAGISRSRVSQKVHNDEIPVVLYNGGYLIYK